MLWPSELFDKIQHVENDDLTSVAYKSVTVWIKIDPTLEVNKLDTVSCMLSSLKNNPIRGLLIDFQKWQA